MTLTPHTFTHSHFERRQKALLTEEGSMAESLPGTLSHLTLNPTEEKDMVTIENDYPSPIKLEIVADLDHRIQKIHVHHPQNPRVITRQDLFGSKTKYDHHFEQVVLTFSKSYKDELKVEIKRSPLLEEIMLRGCIMNTEDPFHFCFKTCPPRDAHLAREATYDECSGKKKQKTSDDKEDKPEEKPKDDGEEEKTAEQITVEQYKPCKE